MLFSGASGSRHISFGAYSSLNSQLLNKYILVEAGSPSTGCRTDPDLTFWGNPSSHPSSFFVFLSICSAFARSACRSAKVGCYSCTWPCCCDPTLLSSCSLRSWIFPKWAYSCHFKLVGIPQYYSWSQDSPD